MKDKKTIICVGILMLGIIVPFIFHIVEVKTTSFNPNMVTKFFESYEEYDSKAYPDKLNHTENNVFAFKMKIKNDSTFSIKDVNVIIDKSKLESQNIFSVESLNENLYTISIPPKSENEIKIFFEVPKNEEIKLIETILESNILIRYAVDDVVYECKLDRN